MYNIFHVFLLYYSLGWMSMSAGEICTLTTSVSKINDIFSDISFASCGFGNSVNLQVVFSCLLFHVIYLGYRRSKIVVEDVDICSYLAERFFKRRHLNFKFFISVQHYWRLKIPLILHISFSWHGFLPIVRLCSYESCLGLSKRCCHSRFCFWLFALDFYAW